MASNTFAVDVSPLHVEAVIRRMKQVYDVDTNTELAHRLGLSSITFLSSYKKRGRLPLNTLMTISMNQKVSLDWLIYGDERGHLKIPGRGLVSKAVDEGEG